ncbi:caspase-1 isoform X2 [Temnothorax americanus]|uniref:caspase-1 isoform X2 n=1 Tax=Temnothorax americanus TaxID=1964332 RepID=UPI004067F2C7
MTIRIIDKQLNLGKSEHDAYQMLRHAHGERCMSRSQVHAYYEEFRTETNNVKSRSRSNSVVDSSSCFRKYSTVFEARNIRNRSKSVSTTDYFMSTEQQECNTDDLCIAGPSQSNETKKSDTTDAKANNVPVNKISDSACTFKEPTAYASVAKDAESYNMNHKNRGMCIIFNHEKFDLSYDTREGSALDAQRLEKTFGDLGFDVELCHDFTHSEIIDKIEKVSQVDHTNNDCLCVITLTHGVQNDLICAKDVIYKSDRLWKPFAGDKCITLAGKPKLFFIQACRGDESDSGVMLSPRTLVKTETDSVVSYAIPTHADFLIAHSSVQGFFTWRNPSEGTWYIQCLCDILDEHGTTMDLMNILTLTARKVATEFSSVNTDNLALHNKRQVPSVTTMLIRSVYFPPKLRNE